MARTYDTIIIGAGLAGISAARTLLQNNVKDILILEGIIWARIIEFDEAAYVAFSF